MIHSGTPLSRCIYTAAIIGINMGLQSGCASLPNHISTTALSSDTTASGSRTQVSTVRPENSIDSPSVALQGAYPLTGTLDEQLIWTFEHGRNLVELETGLDLNHVTIKVADEKEILFEVTRVTEKLVSEQFDDSQYAELFLQKIVGDQRGTYAALYVDEHQQVLISRSLLKAYVDSISDPAKVYPALLALLVHELVHAADDVKYGIHKNRVLSFKASFTQSAAFEGHAQFLTRTICTKNNCLQGMDALETFMFETTQVSDPVAQSVQAISRNVLEYSYIEGERFLTELSKRKNGNELIDRVLRTPPDDPVQILVPNTYPDIARENRNNQLFTTLLPDDHIWSTSPWKLIETSPIKGIDVRNDPARRTAAIEGFTELIVSMTGAQLYNQSNFEIAPIDIMLIEAENPATAKLFAESFVNRSANSISGSLGSSAVQIDRFESQGLSKYSLFQVSSKYGGKDAHPASAIGLVGQYVVQITASMNPQDRTLESYARKVISSVSAASRGY